MFHTCDGRLAIKRSGIQLALLCMFFAPYLVSKLYRTHINLLCAYKISYLSKSSRILDSTTRSYDSILSEENRSDSESRLWLPWYYPSENLLYVGLKKGALFTWQSIYAGINKTFKQRHICSLGRAYMPALIKHLNKDIFGELERRESEYLGWPLGSLDPVKESRYP